MLKVILILLVVSFQEHETARIFAWFPTPSISHQVVLRPITQELARRGHEVTVMTTDPVFPKGQTPQNLTEIDVHDISYGAWRAIFMANQNKMSDDLEVQVRMIYESMLASFFKQLKTPEMQRIIKGEQKFDLLLIEGLATGAMALTHVLKVPVILVSSFGPSAGQLESLGAPGHPFPYPFIFRKRTFNLTIWEKLQELYLMWQLSALEEEYNPVLQNGLIEHFGEDLPSVRELANNVDLIMLNEHPVWTGVRPVPPNVIYIGGIHQNPKTELPQDLKTYLDSSKHGVIYMSFGTNVDSSMLPPEKIQAFIKAFSELPYDVLWKWNEDELPGRTKNIRISKWLPQSDLLHHPNVKLFITQGGLQSTDEAITAGVPVIGVPMLADQWFNVEHYVHHQVGLQLDIQTLDADIVKNAIETVIGNPSYRENIIQIRDLMRDELSSPLERAVWWTEHALRHGGARHLRAPAANMPWRQYYELDLVLLVVGSLIVILIVGIVVVSFIVRLLMKNFKGVKVKSS